MRKREFVTLKEAAARVGCSYETARRNFSQRRVVGAREIGIGVRVAVESGRHGYRLVPTRKG